MIFEGEELVCVRGERPVFAGLDFRVGDGEILLLEGRNGAGKSSLLRICSGLLKAAGGRLLWDGRPADEDWDEHHGRLQYVGHQDALKPVLTVAENLRFWARVNGVRVSAGGVDKALERMDLRDLATVPARFLSAGQRRRVNLARLLATPARLWLLDEPTTSLDTVASAMLAEVVRDHAAHGGMAMIATHLDLGLAGARRLALEPYRLAV
ncbi:heme ABC exporter ATP-binding protein CcmA [Oceanibacterium hippocampi]|uniref:Cytochrome c biogenesis ATP-binding export protein CcmA n=1 Tax=Oceanibacterium hippocampi TaxID=745714 RepID=A0A1Y5RHC9_9PROT|nr:heme ABC exporter ATP-binding protein CcmA [Oceanibacterium hippocampi]SLN14716.1 Cytochrome c biogenesis ATP-binding export protein CcmA [Oceanibacterium hippocampi]